MKKYLIAIIACFSIWLPCAQAASASRADLEQRVFKLINQHRVSIGLDALKNNSYMHDLARQHSTNMADGTIPFGHDGFSDRFAAMVQQIDQVNSAGENVAYTTSQTGIAKQFVTMWLNSAGHRANIENGNYARSGIGIKKQAGYIYITQIFAN